MTITEILREVSEEEGFTPLGLYRTIRDIQNNPTAYGEDYLATRELELFGEYGINFADITKETAIAAENRSEATDSIFGHPVGKVIRWMGKEGWSYSEAKKALRAYGIKVEKKKVAADLHRGAQGASTAELSDEDTNEIYGVL